MVESGVFFQSSGFLGEKVHRAEKRTEQNRTEEQRTEQNRRAENRTVQYSTVEQTRAEKKRADITAEQNKIENGE